MKRCYGIVFLLIVSTLSNNAVNSSKEKPLVKKENLKKKTVKHKAVPKKTVITPYEVAKNISIAVNFLINHKDYMSDIEPLLVKRRKIALDIYRAEAFCILTMADACFPARKNQEISKLLNWGEIHPLLGKDVYSDGVKKMINVNLVYNNDSYYKASQSEIARDKLREVVHENLFSIIDVLNKISGILPGEFYYSGHPYEGIAPLDHVALYNALSDNDTLNRLSSLDSCYHKWQVAFYRNSFLLLKFIAKAILESKVTAEKIVTDDQKIILKEIAAREVGDDNIALPKNC